MKKGNDHVKMVALRFMILKNIHDKKLYKNRFSKSLETERVFCH
jgi:hypothetical protein